jgi:uncharacterized protein YggT (Ycf19 family)
MHGIRAIEFLILMVVLDVFLAWVQTDCRRWPRRPLHLIMTPVLMGPRAVLSRVPTGGWDLSPILLVALLTLLRVWWSP